MTGNLIHAKHMQAEVKNKEKFPCFLAYILKTQLHKLLGGGGLGGGIHALHL